MYEVIYDEMVDALVAIALQTPLFTDVDDNPVDKAEQFGMKQTIKITKPGWILFADESGFLLHKRRMGMLVVSDTLWKEGQSLRQLHLQQTTNLPCFHSLWHRARQYAVQLFSNANTMRFLPLGGLELFLHHTIFDWGWKGLGQILEMESITPMVLHAYTMEKLLIVLPTSMRAVESWWYFGGHPHILWSDWSLSPCWHRTHPSSNYRWAPEPSWSKVCYYINDKNHLWKVCFGIQLATTLWQIGNASKQNRMAKSEWYQEQANLLVWKYE